VETNNREVWWKRLQRGQALVEYWPTIPASVAIMIAAAVLVNWINGTFLKTANALDRYCSTNETVNTVSQVYNHRIESSASVYDPSTNRTTVAYTVTSGSQPSISHWVLGIPRAVADKIIQTSEPAAWIDVDPTTGAAGLKFDIGYESSGGESGGGGNGGNGNGKGGKAAADTIVMAKYSAPRLVAETSGLETRTITITLYGNYEFGTLNFTTKAGSDQVGTGTVSGPIALAEDDQQNNNDDSGGTIDRSQGC